MTTLEERAARPASEILSWTRSHVDPPLRSWVDSLPDSTRRIAAYHFGWQDEHGRAIQANAGKALRPALVLLCAQAVGGSPADAVPGAVAVELVHNFSLLHDDVMDADVTRRHRATAWRVFGVNQAILAGDALLALAFATLAASPRAVRTLHAAVQGLADGQCADLEFEGRSDVDLDDALYMAQRKTAALLRASCALGALFGGGTEAQLHHLSRFGEHLGLAFQVVDDLLGIWGDPALTGKPVHSDLRSHKKTLPVVAALMSGSPASRALAELYLAQQALSRDDLARAAQLVDHAGGRRWCLAHIDEQLSTAMGHLRSAELTEQAAAELDGLAQLATRRDF